MVENNCGRTCTICEQAGDANDLATDQRLLISSHIMLPSNMPFTLQDPAS